MMIPLLYQHRLYVMGLLGFFVFMLVLIGTLPKGAEVLYFSQHRTEFGNIYFAWLTKLGEWQPYALSILAFSWQRRYKAVAQVIAVVLLVVAISGIAKWYFGDPRPYAYFEQIGLLEELTFVPGVNLHKGHTSFPSGHTMSAFAFFTLLTFLLPYRRWGSVVFLGIAIGVGISRMYLAQHFLEDVCAGAYVGFLIGLGVYLAGQHTKMWRT